MSDCSFWDASSVIGVICEDITPPPTIGTVWTANSLAKTWIDVVSSSDGVIRYATANEGLYKSADSGATWSRISLASIGWNTNTNYRGLDCSLDGSRIIINLQNEILCSPDGGSTWFDTGLGYIKTAVSRVGNSSSMLAMTWNGSSSDVYSIDTTTGTGTIIGSFAYQALSLSASNDGVTILVSPQIYDTAMYISVDSGLNFSAIPNTSTSSTGWYSCDKCTLSGDGLSFIGVRNNSGTALVSHDVGNTVSHIVTGESSGLFDCATSSNGNILFVVGYDGARISEDGGATWNLRFNFYSTAIDCTADGVNLSLIATDAIPLIYTSDH